MQNITVWYAHLDSRALFAAELWQNSGIVSKLWHPFCLSEALVYIIADKITTTGPTHLLDQ